MLFVLILRRAAAGRGRKGKKQRCCYLLATPMKNEAKELMKYYF